MKCDSTFNVHRYSYFIQALKLRSLFELFQIYIYSFIYLVNEKIHIYLISFMIFKFCQQNSISLEPSLILIIFIRCLVCSFIL